MKSKYKTFIEPKFEDIKKWVRAGVSEKEIAKNLGVGYSTFRSARDKHEALSTLLINAHEVQNQTVEGSLFKLATGYTVMVKRPIKVRNVEYDSAGHKVCETETVVMADYEEAIPANVLAQQYWLNNRYKAKWKAKQEDEISGEENKVNVTLNVTDMSGDKREDDKS